MKMVTDDDAALIIKALDHYADFLRATGRDDRSYREVIARIQQPERKGAGQGGTHGNHPEAQEALVGDASEVGPSQSHVVKLLLVKYLEKKPQGRPHSRLRLRSGFLFR
jgi:hypothetical protein